MPVPNSRIYVVTDPALAAAVQRNSKALSFAPLLPQITRRVLGLSPATVEIVSRGLDPEPGEAPGFIADIQDMVGAHLGPGRDLADLTGLAARELTSQVRAYVRTVERMDGRQEVVPLLDWVRHFVTVGTARFLYGPRNPIAPYPPTSSGRAGEKKDADGDADDDDDEMPPQDEQGKRLEAAFWDFDHGLGGLLMGVFPSLTARRAYLGREALTAAMADYLERDGHLGASRIVQNRVRISERHGISVDATARSELSFLFAGIVNTATTTFWIVLQLFADSALLQRVRDELEAALLEEEQDDGKAEDVEASMVMVDVEAEPTAPPLNDGARNNNNRKRCSTLGVEHIKASCPTLLAVFRECLRLGSDNYSTRLVKTDTLLAGRWFLGANTVVQIAGGVIHADADVWGRDVAVFNPARFMPREKSSAARSSSATASGASSNNSSTTALGGDTYALPAASSGINPHPAAFRAFGGGKTLCPGRHFATNEILTFAAMIVLNFDLEALDGGALKVPRKDDTVMPVHILEPVEDVTARIRLRSDEVRRDLRVV